MCLWFPTSYGQYMWNCVCDSQPLQSPPQFCFTSSKARPVPHGFFLQYQLLKQQQQFWKRTSSYYKITKRLKLRSFHTFRWLVCSNLRNNGCLLVCGSNISYRERLFSTAGDLVVITVTHHPSPTPSTPHFAQKFISLDSDNVLTFPIKQYVWATRLTYNCAHLRLNNKKN